MRSVRWTLPLIMVLGGLATTTPAAPVRSPAGISARWLSTVIHSIPSSASVVPSWGQMGIEGLTGQPSWKAQSNQYGARLGYSVGTAGDVNGDGCDDVIVGAYLYDNGQTDEGQAFVYYGSATGPSTTPSWTAEGNQTGAAFGQSVGTAGDVNGDGYDDVIVGADYYDHGQADEGRAFVYYGSATGLSSAADWTAQADQTNALFGYSVGTAGDVNGDGFDDVIVGAWGFDPGGQAYAFYGSATGLSATPNWTGDGGQGGAEFGYSVGTAGDVNGDGYDDVIVGAIGFDNDQSNEGRAFVYHGSAAGLSTTANWTAEVNKTNAYFGQSVGTAGDVNGDGYDDVIVGDANYKSGHSEKGRAYVYHGSAAGLSTKPNWIGYGAQVDAEFGWSVGTAGDVNGDGHDEIVLGVPYFDHGEGDEGVALVYQGGPG
jgi:hypothetical protein